MIRYALKCANGHDFESWFASAAAYDALAAKGMVTCVVCGGSDVTKAVMAPRVAKEEAQPSKAPVSDVEAKIAALRAKIEGEATYVGGRFAEEARAIHKSDAPDTAIWGEASPADAKSLLEDGIPVAPLPFKPKRKMT
ncbi:MAG: DUF1178 family protein [Pseudomonadota bacterium]